MDSSLAAYLPQDRRLALARGRTCPNRCQCSTWLGYGDETCD